MYRRLMSDSFQGTIFASHHVFYLRETHLAGLSGIQPDRSNGLIGAHSGVCFVFTGIHTGEVSVAVAVLEHASPASIDDWEEVVEVSMLAPHGRVRVTSLFTETEAERLYPFLTQHGPGHYRVRVHARGRDAVDSFVTDSTAWERGEPPEDAPPPEEYLIMIWPGSQAPTEIHKQTDAYGARQRQHAARQGSPDTA
ncbi:hypothetical protein GCM10010411_93870 [Actinomadura fulvescens]|uniref:Uncharacterized protein n=1 Tax=Actinomadura fulvescens TaxID=46160 RepID=A0ABN3QZK0_9ACTN